MSKSADAFRTISEVADVLDTPAHVLRFWESRFSQIKPVKRAGGRRYYRPADVALLGGIKKLLHEEGLTIRGVQKMLREHGVRHVAAFAGLAFEEDEAAPALLTPKAAPEKPAQWRSQPTGTEQEPEATEAGEDPLGFGQVGQLSPDRPDRTAAAEARDEWQRERDLAFENALPLAPDTHYDPPLADGAWIPAASLLRAMKTYHVGQRRDALVAIYRRLDALYQRRRASDV